MGRKDNEVEGDKGEDAVSDVVSGEIDEAAPAHRPDGRGHAAFSSLWSSACRAASVWRSARRDASSSTLSRLRVMRPAAMTRIRSESSISSSSSDEIKRTPTPCASQSPDELTHVALRVDVDAGRRLVENEQLWDWSPAILRTPPSAGCRPRAPARSGRARDKAGSGRCDSARKARQSAASPSVQIRAHRRGCQDSSAQNSQRATGWRPGPPVSGPPGQSRF